MNKTVLITGASRGIGRETARRFALENHNVAINYNSNKTAADSLIEEIFKATGRRDNLWAVKADVSNRSEVTLMFEGLKNIFGPPDILVNNAGIAQQKIFSDITENDWERMFDVNVKGAYHCIQAALPYMINKKRGKIINISSIWGITGASCEVHYSAAKAAVIGMTKALAKELAPSGIQVNCVAPGATSTDMNNNLNSHDIEKLKDEIPLGRFGTSEEISDIILFLASDKADYITGQVISPNGGLVI